MFQGTGEPASGLRDSLRDTAASELTDLRQMAGILNGLRALGSGRVLGEVLTLVMDAAIEVTKAERGFVMLANEHGRAGIQGRSWSRREDAAGNVVQHQRQDPAAGVFDRHSGSAPAT